MKDDGVFPILILFSSYVTLLVLCMVGLFGLVGWTESPVILLAGGALGLIAATVGLGRLERLIRAPQRARLEVEVARTALLTAASAGPPCLVLAGLGHALPATEWLLVPPPVAVAGCGALALFLLLLAYRVASPTTRRAGSLLVSAGWQVALAGWLVLIPLGFVHGADTLWQPTTALMTAFAIAGWMVGAQGVRTLRESVAEFRRTLPDADLPVAALSREDPPRRTRIVDL